MKKSTIFSLLILFLSACSSETTSEKKEVLGASSDSKQAETYFASGLQLFDQGDNQKARAAFLQAIEADPKMTVAWIYKSYTDRSPKEWADDMEKAKAGLATAGPWEKLFYEYNATFLNNDWDKRLELAKKMVADFPDDARSHLELGNTYLSGNKDVWAREAFDKAVQLDPEWTGGYVALVTSYLFSEPKDFKKAETNALKVTQLAPKSAAAQITLGDCYRAQNDLAKARDAYAKAITLDPTVAAAYYKKGHVNSFLGNFDEARQDYADGVKNDDNKFGGVMFTANTWLYQGDHKKALQYLAEQSAKTDAASILTKRDCIEACANIALYYNDPALAKEMATAIAPVQTQIAAEIGTEEAKLVENAYSLYWKTIATALDGKFEEARNMAEEIRIMLKPVNDPSKLFSYEFALGFIDMKENKFAEAVDHFEKAGPAVYVFSKYWLAMAYEGTGNKDKANAYYKDLANYNFNNIGYALIRNDVKKK